MAETLQASCKAQVPNCAFNADANSCHAFGIFMAAVGSLRPSGCAAR